MARRDGVDVREVLRREALAAPAACDNSKLCPPGAYGVSDQYVVLDSFAKLRESDVARGEFKWNFMVQGVTGDEVVGVRDKIDNVIEVQIGPFAMPILPEVPYVLAASAPGKLGLDHGNDNATLPAPPAFAPGAGPPLLLPEQYPKTAPAWMPAAAGALVPWAANPYTQLPFGGRMTIQMREAGLQSYSDRNGARHHFEFTVGHSAATPDVLAASPASGSHWDTFTFTDPIKDVHGLTLVFRNPDIPILFEPDCLYNVEMSVAANIITFRYESHKLRVGDRVIITGSRTGIHAVDSHINRAEGHVVSGYSGDAGLPLHVHGSPTYDPDGFWLDPMPNVSGFAPPPAPQKVTVCVAKRRLRIPVRFRRVVPRVTNFIAP